MSAPARPMLDAVVDTIVKVAAPVQVILFGSYADGDPTEDSDLDLLVVEEGNFGPGRSRREELTRISKTLAQYRMPIDILLYSRKEAEKWKSSPNHVVGNAFRHGKVVYERR